MDARRCRDSASKRPRNRVIGLDCHTAASNKSAETLPPPDSPCRACEKPCSSFWRANSDAGNCREFCANGGGFRTTGGFVPWLIITTSPGNHPRPEGSIPLLFSITMTPLFRRTKFSKFWVYMRSPKRCRERVSLTGGGPQKFVMDGIALIRTRGKVPRSSSGNWGHQLFPSASTTPSHSVIHRPSGYAYSNRGWTSKFDAVRVPA